MQHHDDRPGDSARRADHQCARQPFSLGSGKPGTQLSKQLGSTTVTDQRARLTATWTASVTATNFTSGANTAVLYWSGAATGNGTFVPGQANAAAAQSLNASRTAFSKRTGAGDNSAIWNPTIVVNIPAVGTYTGAVSPLSKTSFHLGRSVGSCRVDGGASGS